MEWKRKKAKQTTITAESYNCWERFRIKSGEISHASAISFEDVFTFRSFFSIHISPISCQGLPFGSSEPIFLIAAKWFRGFLGFLEFFWKIYSRFFRSLMSANLHFGSAIFSGGLRSINPWYFWNITYFMLKRQNLHEMQIVDVFFQVCNRPWS